MEFEFVVRGLGDKPISVWEWKTIQELPKLDLENFRAIVDGFGKMSAETQGLNAPVTFLSRLAATDQRLYLYCERMGGRTVVYGGLKSGKKKLFMRSESAAFKEITPVCCLDFCVCGKVRRQGYGKRLFDFFLQNEGLEASMVAYDAPSSKLLNFLTKHYGLRNYVPQSNNFVVFWQYFGDSGIGDWKSSGSLKDSRLRRGRQGSAPAGVPGASGATTENGQFKGPRSSQDLICAVDRVSQLQAASASSPGAALATGPANRGTFRHDEQKTHDAHESTSSSTSPFPAVDLASPSLQQLRLDPFPSAPTSGRVVKFGRRSGQQSSWDGSVMNQVECGTPLQPAATPDPGSARVRGAAHRAGTGARDCLVW